MFQCMPCRIGKSNLETATPPRRGVPFDRAHGGRQRPHPGGGPDGRLPGGEGQERRKRDVDRARALRRKRLRPADPPGRGASHPA